MQRLLPSAQIYRLGRTNPFKEQMPQYQHSMIVPLPKVKAALQGLKAIYRNGYRYKKSGVLLMGLQPKATVQASLFDDTALQTRSTNMMHVMDAINRKMGKDTLSTGASGVKNNWAMRREKNLPPIRRAGMNCLKPINLVLQMLRNCGGIVTDLRCKTVQIILVTLDVSQFKHAEGLLWHLLLLCRDNQPTAA